MSWNLSFQSVSKADAPAVIDALDFSENDVDGKSEAVIDSMRAQLAAGKAAAKAALGALAGPNVMGSVWGHANGVGAGAPPVGWAADSVGCSVAQVDAPALQQAA